MIKANPSPNGNGFAFNLFGERSATSTEHSKLQTNLYEIGTIFVLQIFRLSWCHCNDKVEIHYNYTEKTISPDNDEDYQDFSFYEFEKTFLIDQRKIGVEPIRLKLKIELYI